MLINKYLNNIICIIIIVLTNNTLLFAGCFNDYPKDHLTHWSNHDVGAFITEHTHKYITHSATRLEIEHGKQSEIYQVTNGIINYYRYVLSSKDPLLIRDSISKQAVRFKSGNCTEYAYVAARALKAFGYPRQIDVLGYGDHVFLLIGGAEQDAYVVDPWNQEFYPHTQLRQQLTVYMKNSDSTQVKVHFQEAEVLQPEKKVTFIDSDVTFKQARSCITEDHQEWQSLEATYKQIFNEHKHKGMPETQHTLEQLQGFLSKFKW